MLKVKAIHVYYGAIHALKGVSFEVQQGELVTLLGANGAGKTTTLKTVSGLLRPARGSVELEGKRCTESMPMRSFVAASLTCPRKESFPTLHRAGKSQDRRLHASQVRARAQSWILRSKCFRV